jgi:hypothetical protein
MFLRVELVATGTGQGGEVAGGISMAGALDDVHSICFELFADLGDPAGYVPAALGSHQCVAQPAVARELQQAGVGVRVISEARHPGRVFER